MDRQCGTPLVECFKPLPDLNEMLKIQKCMTPTNCVPNSKVEALTQCVSKLKKQLEAQTKMLNLTINVYLKEKIHCTDVLTRDEVKVQRRLQRVLRERSKEIMSMSKNMNNGGKDADDCSCRPLQVCDACDICNLCNVQFDGDNLICLDSPLSPPSPPPPPCRKERPRRGSRSRGCTPRSKSPIKMRPPWVGVVELPQMELDPVSLLPETPRSQHEALHSESSCLNTGRSSRPPSPVSLQKNSSRRGNSQESNSRCSRPQSSPPRTPCTPPCNDSRSPPPTPCRACTPTHDRSVPPPQFAPPEKLDCSYEPPPSVGSFGNPRLTKNCSCQKPSMPPSPMPSSPPPPPCQQSVASPSSPNTSKLPSPPPLLSSQANFKVLESLSIPQKPKSSSRTVSRSKSPRHCPECIC